MAQLFATGIYTTIWTLPFRARETHQVTARALMFAIATNSKGLRELVGFKANPNESTNP